MVILAYLHQSDIYSLVQRFVYTFDAVWSQIYFIPHQNSFKSVYKSLDQTVGDEKARQFQMWNSIKLIGVILILY